MKREKEGDEEVREREREGRNCGGLSVCEMRFMHVGNKKILFSFNIKLQ